MSFLPGQFESKRYRFTEFDPDQFREVVDRSHLEHTMVAPAPCLAEIHRTVTPNYSSDSGFYSFPVLVRGQFAPGRICIGISRGTESPTWVNGIELTQPSLQIYAEGAEMLYKAGKRTNWMAFSISREEFQEAALRLLGRELQLPSSGLSDIQIDEATANRLFSHSRSRLVPSLPEEESEGVLFTEIIYSIAASEPDHSDNSIENHRRHLDLVTRADSVIRGSIGLPYSSEVLCQSLGTTERTLQIHFRRAFGMSPKAWFQRLSLNRAHSQLMRAEDEPGAIARIAMQCGFDHLGRFSQKYKELFDELPSTTLRKRPPSSETGSGA